MSFLSLLMQTWLNKPCIGAKLRQSKVNVCSWKEALKVSIWELPTMFDFYFLILKIFIRLVMIEKNASNSMNLLSWDQGHLEHFALDQKI